jgi:hypothetical protein
MRREGPGTGKAGSAAQGSTLGPPPGMGASSGGASGGPEGAGRVDQAFDLWLHRSLHQLYDRVAAEPLPEELLKLIEEDRARRGG